MGINIRNKYTVQSLNNNGMILYHRFYGIDMYFFFALFRRFLPFIFSIFFFS